MGTWLLESSTTAVSKNSTFGDRYNLEYWPSNQRSCSCGQWKPEVRPRPDAAVTRRAQLARRTWMHRVQTQHDDASLSEWYHSWSGCSVCSSLCDCFKATSSFCCQSLSGSTILLTEFVRTSVLIGCRSANVELATETFAWSCPHYSSFWTIT